MRADIKQAGFICSAFDGMWANNDVDIPTIHTNHPVLDVKLVKDRHTPFNMIL